MSPTGPCIVSARTHHLLRLALVVPAGAVAIGACSNVSALEAQPGTCFTLPEGQTVTSVESLDCTHAHDAQVIATTTLDAQSLPSSADLDDEARTFCTEAFADFVGVPYARSSLDLLWWVPTEDSWRRVGDRGITCVAVTPDRSQVSVSFADSGL